jgi:glycosyltransferase involved in cell wall biosynthesis
LREYDLLIQPSLYEGFGLTVVEGMIAKVPVLVSNTDGPMNIIDSEQYGYSFTVNDSSDLTNKILFIYNNNQNEMFHNKLEKSYQYALNKFDIRNTANNYINEYLKLL